MRGKEGMKQGSSGEGKMKKGLMEGRKKEGRRKIGEGRQEVRVSNLRVSPQMHTVVKVCPTQGQEFSLGPKQVTGI